MKRLFLLLALGAFVALSPLSAVAQCNGYDQFQTSSPASFDLGPGIGVVNFLGVPIASSYGNSDTIIQRTPTNQSNVCAIQVWALFLKSTRPITINGQSVDVYATVNNTGGAVSTSVLPQPDALQMSTGTLTITSSGPSGGTFDSDFTVNADLIFVKAGTSVTNPANIIGHQPAPGKRLVAIKIVWSTTRPPNYPGCLKADIFFVYQISGVNHLHSVKVATVTCGAASTRQAGTAGAVVQPICACAVPLQ
ncbi:MAG TPA: hypothetical protein VI636_01145 [Candidatus Angelobacter sp.]